jgi:site-specific DNA-methyltransferase (adenine-specific)
MQVTKSVFGLIPLQNFDEPWTDEKLYKKYSLTKEEIDFIESMIRPME